MFRALMKFHPLPILAFLTLALVASHAALAPELYWKSMLPNTPMPKFVRDLLQSGKGKPGGTSINIRKGGVNMTSEKGKPGGTNVNFGSMKKKRDYRYAENENLLRYDPNENFYFLEKDMHTGKTMNLDFTEISNMVTFLPRQVAKSIPFSSNKLPEIFNQLSVKPGSVEAEIMADTIKQCEKPGIKGEEKYCATSLESIIDFSTSKLGKNLQAICTEMEKQTQMQKYTIADGIQKMSGDKSVVCHKESYAYVVFFCHATQTTRAYMVPLEGADGTKAKAVAVCHQDTSAWNPKHLAFQVLKVGPGTVPICHFLGEDSIVWVPI